MADPHSIDPELEADEDSVLDDPAHVDGGGGHDDEAHDAEPLVLPTTPDARHRFDLVHSTVLVLLTLLGIAPIWVTDILPLLDAASHQHLIRLIHDYSVTPIYQHHYEEVHAIVPYLTYYKAVDWLMVLLDVETANRVVLSLCLAALPMAASSLLRAIDHNRWLVLGVFPWMLNSDFYLGFFNYLMSIPLFLWLLAAHIRLLRNPNWPRAVLVAGLTVLLALTHYLLWAVSLVLLPLLALVFGLRSQRLRGLAWMLREVGLVMPSVLVLLPWFLSYFVLAKDVRTPDQVAVGGATLAQRLSRVYSGQHLGPMDDLRQLVSRMFDNDLPQPSEHLQTGWELLTSRQGELASFLWLVGLALWIIGSVKRERVVLAPRHARKRLQAALGAIPPAQSLADSGRVLASVATVYVGARGVRVRVPGTSYIGWVLALMTAIYFALPQHLARPIYLYGVDFRLVEVLGVLAVIALPVCPLLPPRHVRWRVWIGTALMAIVSVLVPLHTAGTFMMVRTEYGSIREAFGSIPAGRNVLTLRMKRGSRYLREMIFSNIGEYYAVFQGGYVPYSFADSSSKPIVTRTEAAMPAPTWFDHTTFSLDAHGKYYDYIVIFRDLEERPGSWERSLASWHRVYQRDNWQVYRNPAPEHWPPPTPAELARAEAYETCNRWILERMGFGPTSTMPQDLDVLLRELVQKLQEVGVADMPPPRFAPNVEGARRRRRLGPARPPRPGSEPSVQPSTAPDAPPEAPQDAPQPDEPGDGPPRVDPAPEFDPPEAPQAEPGPPGPPPPGRGNAPESDLQGRAAPMRGPPGPEAGGAADPARAETVAPAPEAEALMPVLPSRLPVFGRAGMRLAPNIDALRGLSAQPGAAVRGARGDDMGAPPEPRQMRWWEPSAHMREAAGRLTARPGR